MGANTENTKLMEELEADETLKTRGYTAACGPTGGVVLDRWNHVRGLWHYVQGHYFWTPAGYNAPTFCCTTHEEALRHTLETISKH